MSSKDITGIQVAIWHSVDNPVDLDRGVEDVDVGSTAPSPLPEDVIAVEGNRKTATDGLTMYQLKPHGLKGVELFNHMITHRLRE
jgi:hypothetical protein